MMRRIATTAFTHESRSGFSLLDKNCAGMMEVKIAQELCKLDEAMCFESVSPHFLLSSCNIRNMAIKAAPIGQEKAFVGLTSCWNQIKWHGHGHGRIWLGCCNIACCVGTRATRAVRSSLASPKKAEIMKLRGAANASLAADSNPLVVFVSPAWPCALPFL